MKISMGLFSVLLLVLLFEGMSTAHSQECPENGQVINGSLSAVGPVQDGRLVRIGPPNLCSALVASELFNTDPQAYTIHDLGVASSQSCVSVNVITTDCEVHNENNVFMVAYLNQFNPMDILQNFAGDPGQSGPDSSMEVIVPAGNRLLLVASTVFGVDNCTYSFTISDFNCGGTTNVPTLSEWGLIAMAGILGLVGFMVLRRRKAVA